MPAGKASTRESFGRFAPAIRTDSYELSDSFFCKVVF
jgi:hypothetical protein